MQSVGKQQKYKLCFIWKIKSYNQHLKFTMAFVNVGKIISAKQKETPLEVGQNMIILLKILKQQGTLTDISTMLLTRKFYATSLKRLNT